MIYFALFLSLCQQDLTAPNFASGVKVGEVDQTSAIVWVRLTKDDQADFSKLKILTEGLKPNSRLQLEMPLAVVPGVEGLAQVRFWPSGKPETKRSTTWVQVSQKNDCIHQFKLKDLEPGLAYEYEAIAKRKTDSQSTNRSTGRFKTAPTGDQDSPIKFIVSTCQAIRSIDSGKDGHRAYQQMLSMQPNFFVHTGDILYYDKTPFSKNVAAAQAKWNLMFAYGHNRRFHQNTSSYFMKDDHDTLKNDCWPGQSYGDLTFEQGLEIFRRQVPMGSKTYRTVRWGKHVQIWMTENRDFRSPNKMQDGPTKTILGVEQKQWLKNTVAESNATFRFIISPGPIVGPDKKGKNDNHSNLGFATEGQELRDFIAKQTNTFVVCGDRHWQYCSQDPKTGVMEFGCGPINDEHNFGGTTGRDSGMHRYFGAKGGFLMVSVDGGRASVEWFSANDKDWSPGKRPRRLHVERLSR